MSTSSQSHILGCHKHSDNRIKLLEEILSFRMQVVEFDIVYFKQKTAYDMRISDWSSDVCSSDLNPARRDFRRADFRAEPDSAHGPSRPQGVRDRCSFCLGTSSCRRVQIRKGRLGGLPSLQEQ